MWDPDQEMDDGWEIRSQNRWQKSHNIWGDKQDEWANSNNCDEEQQAERYEDQYDSSEGSDNGDEMNMVGESDSSEESNIENNRQTRGKSKKEKGDTDERTI